MGLRKDHVWCDVHLIFPSSEKFGEGGMVLGPTLGEALETYGQFYNKTTRVVLAVRCEGQKAVLPMKGKTATHMSLHSSIQSPLRRK